MVIFWKKNIEIFHVGMPLDRQSLQIHVGYILIRIVHDVAFYGDHVDKSEPMFIFTTSKNSLINIDQVEASDEDAEGKKMT